MSKKKKRARKRYARLGPYYEAANAVGLEIPMEARLAYNLDPYRIARLAVEAYEAQKIEAADATQDQSLRGVTPWGAWLDEAPMWQKAHMENVEALLVNIPANATPFERGKPVEVTMKPPPQHLDYTPIPRRKTAVFPEHMTRPDGSPV